MLVQVGDWKIPRRLAGGLARYVLERIPTGGFLEAVLANDLSQAVGRADSESVLYLVPLTLIVHNYVPGGARRDLISEWINGRGDPECADLDRQVRQLYGKYWEGLIDA
jgi:hypothetical protein